jgi:acyl carrier protein
MDQLALVQRVFREVLDNEDLKISRTTTQQDLEGWDSVAQVKIIISLEAELGVRFPNDEVAKAKSVGDLLALVDGTK